MRRKPLSRLPIRVRITLAFTAAIAIVLAAFGSFLYLRSQAQIDESLGDTLELRATDLDSLLAGTDLERGTTTIRTLDPEDSFAQVLDPDLTPVLATAQVGDVPVLTPAELERAQRGTITFERGAMDQIDGRVRLLATPATKNGRPLVSVVGAGLEDRDQSLRDLAFLLLVGGLFALALAGTAGYWVAGRALSPVERMRREAATITAHEPGERLAVPVPDDELRRLATTLNEMLGRLEAGIERERRFVDDASHELRTPLALHKTELELALRYADDESELRAAIESGVEEVDRLAQLADDLLVVARSSEGGLALNLEVLDAAEVLAGLATRFGARVGAAGRSIEVDASPGIPIRADRLRLEQALTNLVENAIRHGAGPISLGLERRGEGARLHVRDSGPGFANDFRARAFERFSRGDEARGRGGAGLGLAIVDAIAGAHGGSAGIEAGPGADVWIDFPTVPPAQN